MNKIELLRCEQVTPTEVHFEIKINDKTIQFAKWVEDDFMTDYEYLKGNELLTEEEEEIVCEFINEQRI
jgi:hypothetical protein